MPSALAETADGQEGYSFCGRPFAENAFGRPLDYNDPVDGEQIALIEHHHLSRDVELLIRGVTSDSPVDDLAYILRQVPNHYRALAAISNHELKNGYRPEYERNNVYSADCYYRRALNLKANDPVVHLLYGIYLHRSENLDAALIEYLVAEKTGTPNAELHYNLGLLYVDLGHYESARGQARKAYEMGYPLVGLKARLDRLGEWNTD